MKKIKYYYNTHSLRYEKLETPFRVKLLRVFGFIATAIVTSAIISYFAFQFIGSPGEKILWSSKWPNWKSVIIQFTVAFLKQSPFLTVYAQRHWRSQKK